MITNVTYDTFKKEVLESEIPVIVDFWATWCGPCQMMHPVLEEIDKEYEGKIKVCKVDSDKEIQLDGTYGVMSIPMFLHFENGKIVSQATGYMPKDALLKALNF